PEQRGHRPDLHPHPRCSAGQRSGSGRATGQALPEISARLGFLIPFHAERKAPSADGARSSAPSSARASMPGSLWRTTASLPVENRLQPPLLPLPPFFPLGHKPLLSIG